MKTPQLRVFLGFAHGSDALVEATTEAVLENLYGSPYFATPPVAEAVLRDSLALFRAKKAAMAQGGTAATAAKNEQKETLIGQLRELAAYVQIESANVLSTLLSSGFHAASTNRAQTPLATPVIRTIRFGIAGQRLVDVGAVPNAKCYELNYALLDAEGTPGPFQSAGLFTASRNMSVDNLVRGASYAFQARAVGGSTGYSGWSDPVASLAP